MKTAMYCFGKFHFLSAVGDMLEQNVFSIPDSVYLVDYYYHPTPLPPYRPILKYFYFQYRYPECQMIYPLLILVVIWMVHLDPGNFEGFSIIAFRNNIGGFKPWQRYVVSECSYFQLKFFIMNFLLSEQNLSPNLF